jgi:copper chaperone CopZ
MKNILFIAAIVYSVAASSQVSKVSLQASGLTCSMCSNAINKALKTLDFVDKVETNLKTSTFEITFKQGKRVDFDLLKNKVEGAGFSVANFVAAIQFNNVQVKSNQAVTVGDKTFQIVNAKDQVLNGTKPVKIIDKGFVSSREYKKNSVASADTKNGKVYHVTI